MENPLSAFGIKVAYYLDNGSEETTQVPAAVLIYEKHCPCEAFKTIAFPY